MRQCAFPVEIDLIGRGVPDRIENGARFATEPLAAFDIVAQRAARRRAIEVFLRIPDRIKIGVGFTAFGIAVDGIVEARR
jgi:hypothetical protein